MVATCVHALGAHRVGHGVHAADDPRLLDEIAARSITLEVCPASNVSLGVYPSLNAVPVRQLFDAGARLALGADDPLIFNSRLLDQYETARHVYGFSDAELASLARSSVLGSCAPESVRRELLADIDAWLAAPPRSDVGP